MSRVFVHGLGAVSPAGWGVPALRAALERVEPLPNSSIVRPGWTRPLLVRTTPPPVPRPAFLAHPRLRRSNAIAQFTVASALEALGDEAATVQAGALRLGIVVCVMAGSVTYSRRFFEETLNDPSTASPLLFPETVFNAPASHLAAYLNSPGVNYTLVGDEGAFVQGLALAADWLLNARADGVVVIGAEEMDWIVADALRLFQRETIHSDGAGALYLRASHPNAPPVELAAVTDPVLFTDVRARAEAAARMRAQLPAASADEALYLGTQRLPRADAAELGAWRDWPGLRRAPKEVLGEAFAASAAWQCVLACDAVAQQQFSAANVSVVGANQQAIGARFVSAR